MNKFSVVFKEGLCKYLIIYDNIKSLIENGKISEGEKLPTIRELADFLEVNKLKEVELMLKIRM